MLAPMKPEILYVGDTSLDTAAGYLAGILAHGGLAFDYVAGDAPLGPRLSDAEPRLYIISGYAVKNLAGAPHKHWRWIYPRERRRRAARVVWEGVTYVGPVSA